MFLPLPLKTAMPRLNKFWLKNWGVNSSKYVKIKRFFCNDRKMTICQICLKNTEKYHISLKKKQLIKHTNFGQPRKDWKSADQSSLVRKDYLALSVLSAVNLLPTKALERKEIWSGSCMKTRLPPNAWHLDSILTTTVLDTCTKGAKHVV